MPLVRRLDSETAHHAGVLLEKYHLGNLFVISHEAAPVDRNYYPELQTTVFGLDFSHCVGLAAGFDKQAEAINEFR